MPLLQKQTIFALNVAKLIEYLIDQGYDVTLGEAFRTREQTWLNSLPSGTILKAHLMRGIVLEYDRSIGGTGVFGSKHLERTAIDLNLFLDGVYLQKTEEYRLAGEYWKSLHPNNRWGGDFKKLDGNHFEML